MVKQAKVSVVFFLGSLSNICPTTYIQRSQSSTCDRNCVFLMSCHVRYKGKKYYFLMGEGG